ncbi:hypothetical protein [Mucilaginibacter terrae]|uniref:GyrI-like small molecule binding domain-containing protein n=1 Tax=Mucilaginibacter terrae TaxID=1955052 RepID=A0ABU3GWT6_9SPHI|nr:hypothetical protein [Mucilaginibacter terrae]MDT3404222.1 hypothetical protein [Mucilaginibacter terrae]
MQKFITYDGLPLKSGGAHYINKFAASELYKRLIDFANHFTNAPQPLGVQLEFNSFFQGEKISFKLLWETIKRFGLPSWSLSQYIGSGTSVWTWNIVARQVDEALAFHEKFNKITFSVTWRFHFINPVNKRVLPGQDTIPIIDVRLHNSQIRFRCGSKYSVSVWFVLPFEELDAYAIEYIKAIKSQLPFTPSNKHWKLWTVNKDKLSSRKLDISILEDGK